MKFTKILTLIILIFFITNFSHADSTSGSNGYYDTPWLELVNCVHQESTMTFVRKGQPPQVNYGSAYVYDSVMEGEACPPFNAEEHELAWNIVTTENIAWSFEAAPDIDELDSVYDCVVTGEACDKDTGECFKVTECGAENGEQNKYSPLDHTCRFGQGGGDPF